MWDMEIENHNHNNGVVPDALMALLVKRRMSPAELARKSGVSKATISLLLSHDRQNTSAGIVAKLARVLRTSTDYLLGLTPDDEPRTLELGELLFEITEVARHLTDRRKRDLLLTARAYLEASDQLKADPDLLLSDVLDLVREAHGKDNQGELLELLIRRLGGAGTPGMEDEPGDGDG